MGDKPRIRDYMTEDVNTICASSDIQDLRDKMKKENIDGLPVCSDDGLSGYVTALDVIGADENSKVEGIMKDNYPLARPNIKISSAGRIMFREGISEMPVIDDGELVGLITNSDIIRSQIERTTPRKVNALEDMMGKVHSDTGFSVKKEKIRIQRLTPTQKRVFSDELNGRMHELKNGLAEPIVVIDAGDNIALADGHHRTVAAHKLGIEELDAYVIEPDTHIELGMIKNSKEEGIESVEDIKVDEDEEHPLIQKMTIIDGENFSY